MMDKSFAKAMEENVRGNADLQEIVALMPINDLAKDALWNVLIVAYSQGAIYGIGAIYRIDAASKARCKK